MMMTFNGRVEAGHFYPVDGAVMPDCRAAVLVLENAMPDISRQQTEAMRRFREEIRKCDEPVPEFERIGFREVEI